MAIRARSDNLSLDIPEQPAVEAGAAVHDFADVWAQREALRQACVRMIGDAARAEDLVQETFLSALKCQGRLRQGQPVTPWLKTVARRRSIDELRGRDRVALMATPPEPHGVFADDPADHVVGQELVDQLRRAIAELSPRERQLLLRQASYGMSLAELAAEEETSIASVRSVLSRARQKLRSSLERGGVFGGLGALPRYIASLRERVVRWGVQLEPTLPAMTGAGARIGEVVAAIVTAIAMFVVHGGLPSLGGSSVLVNGAHAGPDGGGMRIPAVPGGTTAVTASSSAGNAGGAGATTPTTMGSFVPIAVPPSPLQDDGTTTPEETSFDKLVTTETGGVVFAQGGSNSGEKVLYRSDDSGRTWTRRLAVNYVDGQLLVPPAYPAPPTIFLVAAASLLRSDDGGDHFYPVAPAKGSGVMSPAFSSGDPRIILSGSPPFVYDAETGRITPLAAVAPAPTGAGVATATFTTDGAVLWSAITKGPDPADAVEGAAYRCTPSACSGPTFMPKTGGAPKLVRTTDGLIWAWFTSELFVSHDDGASFSPVAFPTGFRIGGLASAAPGQVMIWGSNDATSSALFVSDDDGASWAPLGLGTILTRGVLAAVRLPSGDLLATPTMVRGVMCSHDDGITWASRC